MNYKLPQTIEEFVTICEELEQMSLDDQNQYIIKVFLTEELNKAVEEENYELAAKLKKEIHGE